MIKILAKYFMLSLFFVAVIMVIKCFDIQASSQVWEDYGYYDVELYNFTNTYNYNKNIIKAVKITLKDAIIKH